MWVERAVSGCLRHGKGALDIADLKGNVVKPFTTGAQERCEWTLIPERLEQFDLRATCVQKDDADPLHGQILPLGGGALEQLDKERCGLIDAMDRNPDVIDLHPFRISSAAV